MIRLSRLGRLSRKLPFPELPLGEAPLMSTSRSTKKKTLTAGKSFPWMQQTVAALERCTVAPPVSSKAPSTPPSLPQVTALVDEMVRLALPCCMSASAAALREEQPVKAALGGLSQLLASLVRAEENNAEASSSGGIEQASLKLFRESADRNGGDSCFEGEGGRWSNFLDTSSSIAIAQDIAQARAVCSLWNAGNRALAMVRARLNDHDVTMLLQALVRFNEDCCTALLAAAAVATLGASQSPLRSQSSSYPPAHYFLLGVSVLRWAAVPLCESEYESKSLQTFLRGRGETAQTSCGVDEITASKIRMEEARQKIIVLIVHLLEHSSAVAAFDSPVEDDLNVHQQTTSADKTAAIRNVCRCAQNVHDLVSIFTEKPDTLMMLPCVADTSFRAVAGLLKVCDALVPSSLKTLSSSHEFSHLAIQAQLALARTLELSLDGWRPTAEAADASAIQRRAPDTLPRKGLFRTGLKLSILNEETRILLLRHCARLMTKMTILHTQSLSSSKSSNSRLVAGSERFCRMSVQWTVTACLLAAATHQHYVRPLSWSSSSSASALLQDYLTDYCFAVNSRCAAMAPMPLKAGEAEDAVEDLALASADPDPHLCLIFVIARCSLRRITADKEIVCANRKDAEVAGEDDDDCSSSDSFYSRGFRDRPLGYFCSATSYLLIHVAIATLASRNVLLVELVTAFVDHVLPIAEQYALHEAGHLTEPRHLKRVLLTSVCGIDSRSAHSLCFLATRMLRNEHVVKSEGFSDRVRTLVGKTSRQLIHNDFVLWQLMKRNGTVHAAPVGRRRYELLRLGQLNALDLLMLIYSMNDVLKHFTEQRKQEQEEGEGELECIEGKLRTIADDDDHNASSITVLTPSELIAYKRVAQAMHALRKRLDDAGGTAAPLHLDMSRMIVRQRGLRSITASWWLLIEKSAGDVEGSLNAGQQKLFHLGKSLGGDDESFGAEESTASSEADECDHAPSPTMEPIVTDEDGTVITV